MADLIVAGFIILVLIIGAFAWLVADEVTTFPDDDETDW